MRSRFTLRRLALVFMSAALAIPVAASSVGASVDARAHVQSSDSSSEVLATLSVSTDKVSVRRDGKQKFKAATDGQSLREGDTIQTDATGTAEIDYGNDAYTRLDVNTTFTIVVLTDEQGSRQVQGSLETGQTWNRTAALTESGSFEQEGAGANATVRGTAFAIECDAVDHCVFTAVVDDIDLTGLDGVTQLLTPLDQCDSTDSTEEGELTGVLCADITQISADDLPAWILANLLQDLIQRGIDDSGFLTGTVVIDDATGEVVFVPGPTPAAAAAAIAPGAPTNVSATADDGSATVSFSPPASNGGSPITSYTATATPGAGGGATALVVAVPVSASGPSSPITVVGLLNGTSYTFTVTATNAVGTSASSTPSGAVTPFGAPVISATPVDILTINTACSPAGEVVGLGTQVVSQDECDGVTFRIQASNPGAPSYWFVFTDLPAVGFGKVIDHGTSLDVVTATNYAASTTFRFAPVQTEPAAGCDSAPSIPNCFSNYPGTLTTDAPVAGSIQWTDTFTFEARNDAGLSDSKAVTVAVVDDICTTDTEGDRVGARLALGCPAYPVPVT